MDVEREVAVRVDGLSKLYRLGMREEVSDSLATALVSFLKSPLKNYRKYRSLYDFRDVDESALQTGDGQLGSDLLWAVRNISFEVPRGQILGIIGANGAGKSTLLKMLSRITAPTSGRIEISGRVGSLLEVGTGFHPELTGRENIYLNGTILGMRKREVDEVFDQIVEFSGVERFLDTPVKRYSSGMKVRLGFAVAAHLDPEVLIIDEVLAVGDAEFKRKCLGKMESIGESGRTVLFVSHDMPSVTRLCQRVIMIDGGRIVRDGDPHEVVQAYLTTGKTRVASREWPEPESAPGGKVARLRAISIRDRQGQVVETADIRQPLYVHIEFDCLTPGRVLMPTFSLADDQGSIIFLSMDMEPSWQGRERPPGRYLCRVEIPGNLLSEGVMVVNTSTWEWEPRRRIEYHVPEAVAFQVVDSCEGDSARGFYPGNLPGAVRPKLDWQTVRLDADGAAVTPAARDGTGAR
jgi:lipopolysaccharide transport system ATP-binding protein